MLTMMRVGEEKTKTLRDDIRNKVQKVEANIKKV